MLQRTHTPGRATSKASSGGGGGLFDAVAEAGARTYRRSRDLASLIALWPRELEDVSPAGILFVLGKLRRALRAERNRGLRGHWSYDLNRHIGLLSAYKREFVQLREAKLSIRRIARGAMTASPRDR